MLADSYGFPEQHRMSHYPGLQVCISSYQRGFDLPLGENSIEEFKDLRSQFVTSKSDKMGLRYNPMVFTEQGVAMLSSVLNSERAILVNI